MTKCQHCNGQVSPEREDPNEFVCLQCGRRLYGAVVVKTIGAHLRKGGQAAKQAMIDGGRIGGKRGMQARWGTV